TAEAIFVRDDDTGESWSPTPGPIPRTTASGRCVVRHAAGLSSFTRVTHGIAHELDVFVDADDPVKFSLLTVTNTGDDDRTLSFFAYTEWALGPPRDGQHLHIVTELDDATGAIFARNPYNQECARHVAFAWTSEALCSSTGDRRSFLGRHGDISAPAAIGQAVLSGQMGAALDPCAALHVRCRLRPGQSRTLLFLLGEGTDRDHARQLIARHGRVDAAVAARTRVHAAWDHTLNAVQVR